MYFYYASNLFLILCNSVLYVNQRLYITITMCHLLLYTSINLRGFDLTNFAGQDIKLRMHICANKVSDLSDSCFIGSLECYRYLSIQWR